ncbi:MAG: hypothetical protein WCI26_10805 [Acidimicrobiales bacterium]
MGDTDMDMVLDSGHTIWLKEIDQWLVYDGLLDGMPTERLNASLIDHIMASGTVGGRRAVLIAPEQTRPAGTGGPDSGEDAYSLLPRMAVRARFESLQPVSEGGDFSELTMVWFQHTWALPIDDGVVGKIRAVDWAGSARDMIW